MKFKEKITSIELGRVVAIFAILAMHCQMFLSYLLVDGEPWFGYVFNQATRFAVPLFFLISGYLIQPKLSQSPIDTLASYCKPLIKIWIVWSIISLLMPFNLGTVAEHGYLAERQGYWGYLMQAPLNSFLEGGLVHLWFIPALIIAVAILALLVRYNQQGLILPVAVGLFIYGTLAGSYQPISGLEAPFFTRNGPFFSTLLVALGFEARARQWSLTSSKALILLILGMAIHFGEAYYLTAYNQPFNANDFLFGTPLWGLGIFLLLLANPTLGNNNTVKSLSGYVLAIFVSHLPIIILMNNVAGILELAGPMRDLCIFVGTVVLTLALVVGVKRTPLNRILFR